MAKLNYWTNQDDSTVMDCIKNNPVNLQEAFGNASKKINRSIPAIQFRYYQYLKPKHKMFNIKSKKEEADNIKNSVKLKDNSFKIISYGSMKEYSQYENVVIQVNSKTIIRAKEAIITKS